MLGNWEGRRERTAERDRPTLYDSQVVGYVNSAAFGMSPEVAVEVLGYLRAHWRGSSPRQFSFGSWATVVSTLIRRVETSSDAVALFRKQWPNLYVRTPVPRGDIAAGNRQRLAFAWMRAYVADYTVVQNRRLRRVVRTVSLSAHALSASSPASALATYVHECCHAFGRDESASFSAALTDVIELLAHRGDPFATLHAAWLAVGEA